MPINGGLSFLDIIPRRHLIALRVVFVDAVALVRRNASRGAGPRGTTALLPLTSTRTAGSRGGGRTGGSRTGGSCASRTGESGRGLGLGLAAGAGEEARAGNDVVGDGRVVDADADTGVA